MEKIKILHVLKSNSFSGAESVAITIITLTKEKTESVYVSPQGKIEQYLEENRIRYIPIKKLGFLELSHIFRVEEPDIIHAHDFTAGVVSAATMTKIPIISHLHNNPPWIKRCNLRSICYALSCSKYQRILTVSDSIMREYVFGKNFMNKTVVVGNPVDIQRIRKLAGSAEKKYDIAFLGRFSIPKNPNLFVSIIKRVKEYKPDVVAIMIGEGELRTEIEEQIKKDGMQANIICVGFQKNPYRYLAQAKILLMPSSWEGYGLAAVEALALGLPVICSDTGGLPEIVNSECGAICKTEDEYVRIIIDLLSNGEYLKDVSTNAQKRANSLANVKEYSTKLLEVYRDILR